jgi:hypothetical protein
MDRVPLSLVWINEELLENKTSFSGLENRPVGMTAQHPLPPNVGSKFAGRSGRYDRYSSLADEYSGKNVVLCDVTPCGSCKKRRF